MLALADKQIKVKNDKDWSALCLNGVKQIEELQQNWKNIVDQIIYYQTNIEWLQSRFPEAKYADVVGLCKLADKTEYAEEHNYSLNAGRYVGVIIGEDNKTEEEFKKDLEYKKQLFQKLNFESEKLEQDISLTLTKML